MQILAASAVEVESILALVLFGVFYAGLFYWFFNQARHFYQQHEISIKRIVRRLQNQFGLPLRQRLLSNQIRPRTKSSNFDDELLQKGLEVLLKVFLIVLLISLSLFLLTQYY